MSRQRSEAPAGAAGTPLRVKFLSGIACAFLLTMALAAPVSAKIVNLRVYNGVYPAGTFNGEGSVGAPGATLSGAHQMDINRENGDFIVGAQNYLWKFDSTGAPLAFSAIAPNTVVGPTPNQTNWSDVEVDNSGGAGGVGEGEQGRMYAEAESGARIKAWKANGEVVSGAFGGENGLSYGGLCSAAVSPVDGNVWLGGWTGGNKGKAVEFNPDGTPTGSEIEAKVGGQFLAICGMKIDDAGNFYIGAYSSPTGLHKYSPTGEYLGVIDPSTNEARDFTVDNSDGHIYALHTGPNRVFEFDAGGGLITEFGAAEGAYPGLSTPEGVAVDEGTGTVYVANDGRVDSFVRTGNITVPDVTTGDPTVTPTTATLHGEVDPDNGNGGTPIDLCNFEWGTNPNNLNQDAACDQALPIENPTAVTVTLEGLTTGTTYYYKLTAANEGNGIISFGGTKSFEPAGPPEFSNEAVSNVNTDGADISATIVPGGAVASYRVEYGETEAYGSSLPVPDGETVDNLEPEEIKVALSGLTPGTTYHYRFFGSNLNGDTEGADHTFTTFPSPLQLPDTCANAQVRQQTGASLLLDCRAYELASASNTGGYDVQSDLVPGQSVLGPQPGAQDRVLYSAHFGAIPGTGDPTNFGLDPYVATRGSGSWSTSYVGIPANGTPSGAPFGSPLAGASGSLGAFAFGGGNLCDPCFPDGSTGIPVRMSNGSLVQGMKGSLDPGLGAEPSGYVGKAISDDGSHLVFGSTSKFEPTGNDGSLTIYDRNLNAGATQVASTDDEGDTLTGTVAELDMSSNGNRILIGKLVSHDSETGNNYYDLYMHEGTSPDAVVVADTTNGVLFNGMTSDGTKVLFTTFDALAGDSDTSADIYRANVGTSGSTIERVSTGNATSCEPVAGKESPHWNRLSGGPDCSVLGLAGGAGVASGDGTAFFLSPEEEGGSGTENEANLFVARPGGAPELVETIEPDHEMVTNALIDSEVHRYTDFQTSRNGDHAVFASTLPLTGFNTFGHSEVFSYDTQADSLACASCAPTGAAPTSDTTLASGLNLADDGSVFFTTSEGLVLRDTNNKTDVYEWKNGQLELVSTGISQFDSGLLSATADGVNVFFFTRATLVPQDENGNLMKIYDARANGGFLAIPPPPPCAAKDECQGPGTQPAPPPQIGTFEGTGGNSAENCGAHARKAKKSSRKAKKLRKKSKRASSSRSRKHLRNQANKEARRAKTESNAAKRCRKRARARRAG